MRPEIRQILLTMVLPLFLIFILYMIKVLEIGMDWDFTSLGVYPLSKKGMFGIFTHPLIHSSFKHLLTNTLPLFFLSWCLFYFYRSIAPSIFLIIWMWSHYIPYRQACLAYRCQRYYLWTGFLSFLQRTVTKIYPLDCHISISYLSLWRSYMEYAPLFYTIRHFVGRAFKRSYHRYHLCFFFYGLRPAKAGPFRK